jgi:hypothetical protein
MNFLRIIIAYIRIGIGCILFVLFLYPISFLFAILLGTEIPSVKKYMKSLKGILLEGKPIPKMMKTKILFVDISARIKYQSYLRKLEDTQEYSSSLFYITSDNYEDITKTANIPESVKKEIKDIVESGDGVLISEAAFKPDWKYPEKYVVIESFDKKPPKVKYMHEMMHRRISLF